MINKTFMVDIGSSNKLIEKQRIEFDKRFFEVRNTQLNLSASPIFQGLGFSFLFTSKTKQLRLFN